MAVRFRAHLRYEPGSGYGSWVPPQMDVRMTTAFHAQAGTPAEEASHVTTDIVASGPQEGRREDVDIDVFWPDTDWQPGVAYGVGDEAWQAGTVYACISAHTSTAGQTLAELPTLWDAGQTLAQDTVNTLLATVPWLRPDDPDGRDGSWMDWHHCRHDQVPQQGCAPPEWRWP